MKTSLACLVLSGVGIFNIVAADPDTPETRRREAERYLQATPPKAMFEDVANKMSAHVPPEQRDAFKAAVTSNLDIPALTNTMLDSMVKHFTTEELKALADFYGSPIGKSAMKKFGGYMADVMPAIQTQIMKAQTQMNEASPTPSPQ